MVISQKGELTLFEPQPPPKIVLENSWKTQHSSSSSKSLLKVHLPAPGSRQPDRRPRIIRIRKLYAQDESTVEKEPEFKVDLRLEGTAHDVILKDEERMGKILEVPESEEGSYTKSNREDLRKPRNAMIFSEGSSRIIHELGNIELYELGHNMSSTIQCHSCMPERPDKHTKRQKVR